MTPKVRLERARAELETRGLTGSAKRRGPGGVVQPRVGKLLAEALPAIGPLFSLFGRYIAGRTDRLPLRDCRELARLSITAPPTRMADVAAILARRLGGPVAESISSFEAPNRTTLLHQWHHAALLDGTAVTVKIVRPEARALVESELELLPILEDLAFDEAETALPVEDFVVWLDRQLDLRHEVAGLGRLAGEVETFDAFEVPAVVGDLCGRHVAATHRIDGDPLDTLLDAPAQGRPGLSRRFAQAWLQQSVLEGSCPEGPLAENILVLPGGRFAITGGLFTTMDERRRRSLLDGIIATVRSQPDRVYDAFSAVSTDVAVDVDRRQVVSELRQAETFRSGGWTDDYAGRHISESYFIYWRLMTGRGYEPQRPAVAFIRGFSELEAVTRVLAPKTDVMAKAIDDVRMVAAAASVRTHLNPKAFIRMAEDLTPVIGEILEHPERLLAKGGDRGDREDDSPAEARRETSWRIFGGGLAVLAAGALLGVTAIQANPDVDWIGWVVALGFAFGAAGLFSLVRGSAKR